tara:strand:+ start:1095 stop:1367 length:273 start_codon:yes stop_codon:yes gene_type:complete
MTDKGYEAYRKKFPKGKDWQDPKPNPYRDGGSGLHPDSYHGMETIGVSIEKYEELELQLEEVKQQYYFDMRNKQMEIEVLKNQLREARGE